jgi:hypothetical protein
LLIMGATGDGGHFDKLADLLADEFTASPMTGAGMGVVRCRPVGRRPRRRSRPMCVRVEVLRVRVLDQHLTEDDAVGLRHDPHGTHGGRLATVLDRARLDERQELRHGVEATYGLPDAIDGRVDHGAHQHPGHAASHAGGHGGHK